MIFDLGGPGPEDEQGCQRAPSLRAEAGPSETNGEVFLLLVSPYRPRAPLQREPGTARACILLVRIFLDLGIHSPFPKGLRAGGAPLRDSALGCSKDLRLRNWIDFLEISVGGSAKPV